MLTLRKQYISLTLIMLVIALHGLLRFSELPHGNLLLGDYFWAPSINMAANKGFIDDMTFMKESPELAEFMITFQRHSPELGRFVKANSSSPNQPPKRLSTSHSLHTFTDYTPVEHKLTMHDAMGYRHILGLIWKYFGFNWYFVGLLNYLFSLLALLSLMYCSYRILGLPYSLILGFLYSTSSAEIYYVANLGRDGIPLWFACYLICILTLFVNQPLTIKRILGYAPTTGLLVYAATQGRLSCTYFLPLIVFIYFIIFFFFEKDETPLPWHYLPNHPLAKKTVLFSITAGLTILCALLPLQLTLYFCPNIRPGATMHNILLGLGVWGGNTSHPSQICFSDTHSAYMAAEYGTRVLGFQHISEFDTSFKESLVNLYLSIIKNYPYFFLHTVIWSSFHKTLLDLADPCTPLHGIGRIFYDLVRPFSFFIASIVGAYLLWAKHNLKKLAFILVSFGVYNASASLLQYGYRHVLMGYPAYYFLSSVTFVWMLEWLWGWHNVALQFLLKHLKICICALACFLAAFASLKIAKHIEARNIRQMQIFFHSLQKQPLPFDRPHQQIHIPQSFLKKTLGLYCEIGETSEPKDITIEVPMAQPHSTTIKPVVGKKVTLFFPIYIENETCTTLTFKDHQQCKTFYWSDLKDWKGSLWEGTYDEATLPQQ